MNHGLQAVFVVGLLAGESTPTTQHGDSSGAAAVSERAVPAPPTTGPATQPAVATTTQSETAQPALDSPTRPDAAASTRPSTQPGAASAEPSHPRGTGEAPPVAGPAEVLTASPETVEPAREAAGEPVPYGPGQWLVHLGQHQGHVAGRGDPRSVTLHVLALMVAAGQMDANCGPAFLWQFDLFSRIDRPADALAALTRYVDLERSDESAALQLVALSCERLQTAEARAGYLRAQASRVGIPACVASDLHRRLAALHRERRETEAASREIEASLRLMPTNVSARQLGYELFGETEATLQRVELALQMIAASPSQVNLLWELGEMLEALSLHREAQEWFLRAIEIHEAEAGSPARAEYWYQLAQSYVHSNDDARALEAVDRCLGQDRAFARAPVLKTHILRRMKSPEAEAPLADLTRAYDAEVEAVLSSRNVARAAELAWFYAYQKPDRDRALKLATLATSVPGAGSLAQRAMGYAQLLHGQYDGALQTLRPLAAVDQLAAAGFATALLNLQRQGEAVAVLHKAALLNFSGVGYETLVRMLEKLGEKPPGRPPHERIVEAVRRFDRRVFDFARRPGEALRLTLRWGREPTAVGPWLVRMRLENVAPYAVTLGEGLMSQPLVLLSSRCGDDPSGGFEHYTQLLLNRRPMLSPGDAIEVTQAVDLGPVRARLLGTASRTAAIEIRALLDPLWTGQGYTAGRGSVNATPLRATRTGLPRDLAGMRNLVKRAESGEIEERGLAIDALGGLLAEAEQPGADPLAEAPAIRQRLARLLRDSDWFVRARAIEALRWSRPTPETVSAVAPCVQDSHPVVRMMAVRFFAEHQGDGFQKVLSALAESDEEYAVRLLASSYLPGLASR